MSELKKLNPDQLLAKAEELAGRVSELEAKNKELTGSLEKAASDYAQLSKKLDEVKENKGVESTFGEFKFEKATYEVVRPKVNYKGTIYTAQEVIDNKEIHAALIKIGASCIRIKE